jgi:hypothetical protein
MTRDDGSKENLRHRPDRVLRMRRALTAAWIPVALLCSCRSVTYDVRRIEEPMLMGSEVALKSGGTASFELQEVDTYAANVEASEVVASAPTGAYTTTTMTSASAMNSAQLCAYEKIGGTSNRAIRDIMLDVNYVAINALVALGESISISATGKVVELKLPVPAPNTNQTGEETR